MTNVGIKMTLDASQVASVANTTKDAFLGMAEAMKKAQEAGDFKTVSDLAGGMKDLRSASGGFVNSDIRHLLNIL
jgi:thiazole synthase ThiGH ThiG subunit